LNQRARFGKKSVNLFLDEMICANSHRARPMII
jgi:hypothetical protein